MNPFEATNAEAAALAARGPEPICARLDRRDPQQIRCGAAGGTCSGELGRVRYSAGPPAQLQRFIELPPGWAKRADGAYSLTPRAQARYRQAQADLGRGEVSGGAAAVLGGPRTRRPVRGPSMPVPLRPPANSTAICPHCQIRNRYDPKTLGL